MDGAESFIREELESYRRKDSEYQRRKNEPLHYNHEELRDYVNKCNNPEPETHDTYEFGSLWNDGTLKYIGKAKGREHCHLLWDIKSEIIMIYKMK